MDDDLIGGTLNGKAAGCELIAQWKCNGITLEDVGSSPSQLSITGQSKDSAGSSPAHRARTDAHSNPYNSFPPFREM